MIMGMMVTLMRIISTHYSDGACDENRKIMAITSVITVVTMMMKTAAMATETSVITLMTVGSETAIRIKTAIDSSVQMQG